MGDSTRGASDEGTQGHGRVPGPEAGWLPAPAYRGNPNPATQFGGWQYATARMRIVAGLRPPLRDLAARLMLTVEHSWEELGEVDYAMFELRRTVFAFSDLGHPVHTDVCVWLDKEAPVAPALELLLEALGLGEEALSHRWDEEAGAYVNVP